MVEVADRKGLEKWLEDESFEVAVTIAARAAFRVFPHAITNEIKDVGSKNDLTLFSVRALLISSVASVSPIDEIKRAAAAAAAYGSSSSSNALAVSAAAFAAASAAYVSSSAVAAVVYAVASSPSTSSASAWKEVSKDLTAFDEGAEVKTVLGLPLWQLESLSADIWKEKRQHLDDQLVDWSFWIDWYQRILDGRPQNWKMLEEIALIAPEDWDKGAEHVNGLIAEIQARYLREATPYSEKIEVNPDTGNLRSIPTTMENARLYQTALDRVRDALDDLRPDGELAQHHAGLEKVAKRLDRTLARYADNPQRVHDDFLLSAKQITALVESTEVAKDEDVDALQSSLVTGADDIRAADAVVKASVAARVALRLEEMRVEDTEVIAEAVEAIEKISEGELKESSHDDAEFYRSTDRMGVPLLGPANYEESVSYLFRTSAQISAARPLLPDVVDVSGRAGKGLVNGYTVAVILNKAITFLLSLFG